MTVLGELLVDGESPSPRERAVLAALVMRAGRPISADEIADAYWGDRPPGTWPKQVQAAVGRLRRRLGAGSIVTGPGGYTFAADPQTIDASRFERLADAGHGHLAAGEPDRAVVALEDALALWRGPPYADLRVLARGARRSGPARRAPDVSPRKTSCRPGSTSASTARSSVRPRSWSWPSPSGNGGGRCW